MSDAKRDPFQIDGQKVSLHPARVAQVLQARDDWAQARDVFPVYVEISPVGYCNHSCSFCGVDFMLDRSDKPSLAPEAMERLLSDLASHGVKSVMFAGAGEPLLAKGLARAIAHANHVGLDTAITTNGVRLTESFAREALEVERLRWIKVSINGGDEATYQVIHHAKVGDFTKVISNLEAAVRIREEMGGHVTLGAQIVALPESGQHPKSLLRTPSNIQSIEPLARRLRDIGIDYLVVKPYSQHLMSQDTQLLYGGVVYHDVGEWMAALESISTDSFRVVVRSDTIAHLHADARGYDTCHATPFLWAYVEADGGVWGCSAYLGRTEGGKTYGDERFLYGNVNTHSFTEIWRGERRRANFEYVRHGLDISECRKNCRMHQVNLFMERLLNPSEHDNFI